jgi:predicted transcriptional regulator
MIKKVTKAAQVRSYVAANPKAKPAEVAKEIGVGLQYVYTVLWNAKKKAKVVKKTTLTLPKIKKGMAEHKKIMDETIKGWKTLSIT